VVEVGELLARVVDEDLLTRTMDLSHRGVEVLAEVTVEIAEPAVLVGPARFEISASGLAVLVPQLLERDAGQTQLSVDPLHVDRCARVGEVAADEREQLPLELDVVEPLCRVPRHADLASASQVVADGSFG
jgi:hypothetical protein